MSGSLSQHDADFVRDLVYRRSAIVLDESKAYLIESRLHQAANDAGVASAAEVVKLARAGGPSSAAQTRIVEAITTHETTFFRDIQPFDALKNAILPVLKLARAGRPITIWSAACSSGQEPYSIAMLVLEHFPELANGRLRIVATDLSSQVLERARTGIYRQLEVNRGLPAAMAVKYFERAGANWQLRPEVKRLVTFRQLNLLDEWSGIAMPDIVFMRYVLIYFDLATKKGILGRLASTMAHDGALLLGGTETTINVDDGWDRVSHERSTYYKVKR